MARHTEALARRLVEQLEAVRPLAGPWRRAAAWFALAAVFIAVVALARSLRADLATKLLEPRFVVEQTAALLTGVLAAVAAFATVTPGRSRRFVLLPLVPLVVWLGTLGHGCVMAWIQSGPGGLAIRPDWACFPDIALMGLLPAVAMVLMLRRGAPLNPIVTMALGGLAAAGLGEVGLRLIHPQDASVMVLVWQVGSVLLLSALAASAGPYVRWWSSFRRR